jgi:hypothetical protein
MTQIYQVRFAYIVIEQLCYNITYFPIDDSEESNLQAFVDEAYNAFDDQKAFLSTTWQFTGCSFRVFNGSPPFTSLVTPTSGSLSGTGGSTPLPPQLAPVVQFKRTGEPPNRGRIYLTGCDAPGLDSDGELKATYVTAYETMWDIIKDGLEAGDPFPRLLIARPSFSTNTILGWQFVDTVTVDPNYGTQRRRRKGAGS